MQERSNILTYSMFMGFLFVASLAFNIGQYDKYRDEVIKSHAQYVDKRGVPYQVRKVGGEKPTEYELYSMEQCLDTEPDLGLLFQAVVVTTRTGSTFYLEQKREAIGTSAHFVSCHPMLQGKKK